MRALVTAIAATILLGAPVTALGSAEAKRPALKILGVAPIRVQGTSFRAGERVKLLVSAGQTPFTRGVKAGPRGGFVVRTNITAGVCAAIVVQAIGARGSRAMVDITQPGCGERPD